MLINLENEIQVELENGIDPDAAVAQARRFFPNLKELCPSQSFLTARIIRSKGQFAIETLVNHTWGRFYSLTKSKNLARAFRAASVRILGQIEGWRSERFIGEGTKKQNVMIIDDDPESARLMDICLRKAGCNVQTVDSGRMASKLVQPGETDLVFLDWNMPHFSGGETIKAIEHSISTGFDPDWIPRVRVPLIVYSGVDKNKIRIPKTRRLEPFGYIKKTATYDLLKLTVDQLIQNLKTKRPLAEISKTCLEPMVLPAQAGL